MSALVRTIRKAILGNAANRNQVLKESFVQLGITPGLSDPHAILKFRRIILNSGRDDEVQLRRAVNGLNLTGGGSGSDEADRIRYALLRPWPASAVRSAIDDLLETIVPEAPEGFAYLVNADENFIVNGEGSYILAGV